MKKIYISLVDKTFNMKGKNIIVKKGEEAPKELVMAFPEGKSRDSRFELKEVKPEVKEVKPEVKAKDKDKK